MEKGWVAGTFGGQTLATLHYKRLQMYGIVHTVEFLTAEDTVGKLEANSILLFLFSSSMYKQH